MALKIIYPICCGIDVHKTFVVACIASTNDKGVTTYKRHRFSTYTKGLKELLQSFVKITAEMSAWNLPGNTGFPCLIYLKIPATSFLHIPNMLRLSVAKRLI